MINALGAIWGRTPPNGEETSRLFAVWLNLALLLGVAPYEPLYKAVVYVAQVLWDVYHTL